MRQNFAVNNCEILTGTVQLKDSNRRSRVSMSMSWIPSEHGSRETRIDSGATTTCPAVTWCGKTTSTTTMCAHCAWPICATSIPRGCGATGNGLHAGQWRFFLSSPVEALAQIIEGQDGNG